MIRLQNISKAQPVLIPRTVRIFEESGWSLELSSSKRGKKAVFGGLKDAGDKLTYVSVNVNLAGKQLSNGEYLYTLRNGSTVVDTGLAVVGEYQRPAEGVKEPETVIEYNG